MLVSRPQFKDVLESLKTKTYLAVDCETTSLSPYSGGRLFSIAIYDGEQGYYFNFIPYPGIDEQDVLPYGWVKELGSLKPKLILGHNLKFDLHFLGKEGCFFDAPLHDTQTGARMERNDHLAYSLSACAKRIGLAKSEAVKEYIVKHKLYSTKTQPGKKLRKKQLHFDQVPLAIIKPYAIQDAKVAYQLGIHQLEIFEKIDKESPGFTPISKVVCLERELTPVLFRMERRGMRVDLEYCKVAEAYETKRYQEAIEKFESLAGSKFVDSGKSLERVFERFGERLPATIKGNPQATDEVLSTLKSPIAQIVRDYRDAFKRCNTYFRNFIALTDPDGFLRCDTRQSGTASGRMSVTSPALQTLNAEDNSIYPIRRAFIPPSKEFVLLSIDFKSMEFRAALHYAGAKKLLAKIDAGYDPHQASAEMAGITRSQAKVLNFMLLYGGGIEKLASALKVDIQQARRIKHLYFERIPEVRNLIQLVSSRAESRGYIFNLFGRRSYFSDRKWAYKATNFLIQGVCADVLKKALVDLDLFLQNKKSYITLSVHDEVLFCLHQSEFHLVPFLVEIMAKSYPTKEYPFQCDVAFSDKSWSDLVPYEERNPIQEASGDAPKDATPHGDVQHPASSH